MFLYRVELTIIFFYVVPLLDFLQYANVFYLQSPSIIRPAPHWWERGPEVVTFIPTAPETSVAECMQEEQGREELGREEQGREIPYALGKQVEELMADHWETMRKNVLFRRLFISCM